MNLGQCQEIVNGKRCEQPADAFRVRENKYVCITHFASPGCVLREDGRRETDDRHE